MAISNDSLEQRLDKVALDEEQHSLDFEQTEAPVAEPTEAQQFATDLAEASGDLPPHVEPEGVQVAGLKDVVMSAAKRLIPDEKRIVEAEKRFYRLSLTSPSKKLTVSLSCVRQRQKKLQT